MPVVSPTLSRVTPKFALLPLFSCSCFFPLFGNYCGILSPVQLDEPMQLDENLNRVPFQWEIWYLRLLIGISSVYAQLNNNTVQWIGICSSQCSYIYRTTGVIHNVRAKDQRATRRLLPTYIAPTDDSKEVSERNWLLQAEAMLILQSKQSGAVGMRVEHRAGISA